jgi:large subunit ribosomal protein L22
MTGYAFEGYVKENMARAKGDSLPVSTKQSCEICTFIRGRKLSTAKRMLSDVIAMKRAVPFKRFNDNVGHRKGGVGPGRYPIKASAEILKVVEACEANAQFKGLDTASLSIVHANANFASRPWHYGRQSRRKMKRTHIEIVAAESKEKDAKAKHEEKK